MRSLDRSSAQQTLSLYFEPERNVLPYQAEINMKGLAQVIAIMGEAGTLKAPSCPPRSGSSICNTCARRACRAAHPSAALASSQSASISAKLDELRGLSTPSQRALDRGKPALEFGIGGAQHALGSASRWRARLTPRIGGRRLRRRLLAIAAPMASSISSAFLAVLLRTAIGSFQSKPTELALACSLSARVKAGRLTGTPASAPAYGVV